MRLVREKEETVRPRRWSYGRSRLDRLFLFPHEAHYLHGQIGFKPQRPVPFGGEGHAGHQELRVSEAMMARRRQAKDCLTGGRTGRSNWTIFGMAILAAQILAKHKLRDAAHSCVIK